MREYKLRRDNWRFTLRVVSDPRERKCDAAARIPREKLCEFGTCPAGLCAYCDSAGVVTDQATEVKP